MHMTRRLIIALAIAAAAAVPAAQPLDFARGALSVVEGLREGGVTADQDEGESRKQGAQEDQLNKKGPDVSARPFSLTH